MRRNAESGANRRGALAAYCITVDACLRLPRPLIAAAFPGELSGSSVTAPGRDSVPRTPVRDARSATNSLPCADSLPSRKPMNSNGSVGPGRTGREPGLRADGGFCKPVPCSGGTQVPERNVPSLRIEHCWSGRSSSWLRRAMDRGFTSKRPRLRSLCALPQYPHVVTSHRQADWPRGTYCRCGVSGEDPHCRAKLRSHAHHVQIDSDPTTIVPEA